MQSSTSSSAQPEAILEWLQKEMGYRPLGPYIALTKASMPSVDSVRCVYRGNMNPVWNFLLNRVKSEKTIDSIRRNILVHGDDIISNSSVKSGVENASVVAAAALVKRGGRRKELCS